MRLIDTLVNHVLNTKYEDLGDEVVEFELCGTANAFGATAIAGRLIGLDHAQMTNAFVILINILAGSFQGIWDGVHSFKLPGAMSAHNAILAVLLSKNGFQGVKDPRGYFAMYCSNPHPENMLVDLGKAFYVKGQHKLHPSCYGNHNLIECGLEIVRNHSSTPMISSILPTMSLQTESTTS